MKINNKTRYGATFLATLLASTTIATAGVTYANSVTGTPEEQADITNWIANTPQQVSNNMAMQHIDVNNLNGVRYVIQWGDTLSSISRATGISVPKLCYDNNITNANLIYAGNILILNRNGYVPTDFHPDVNPYIVAQTKVTINNGPQNVNINVQPTTIKKYYDNSNNSTNTTNVYKAPSDSTQSSSDSNKDKDNSTKDSSKSTTISAEDIADGLDKANNNDKLSFQATDDASDINDADELDIDSSDITKAVKKDDYDDLLDKINDALDKDKDDKDVTIYIEQDGDDIHIYASYDKKDEDSQSSSKDENNQNSDKDSNDDEDSQSDEKDNSDEDSQNNDTQKSNQTNSHDEDTDDEDD
ncbi:MAG: LysM peptidoglycan-binding domain-containing protein [Lactobacillus sp.]|nr:LysM peptidoglycan-binding domain-containing protein [Lactobacillus sp.]